MAFILRKPSSLSISEFRSCPPRRARSTFQAWNIGAEMPYLRQTSATFIPASCSRSTRMICSSVNRLRFVRPSPSGSRNSTSKTGGVFRAQVIAGIAGQ